MCITFAYLVDVLHKQLIIMKTYYYNLKDHSWDEMRWVMCVDEEMTAIDNHVRVPEDWTTMVMPTEVFKSYKNLILMPKVKDPKRINTWVSFYQDHKSEWNANGFVKCKVEGQGVIIESLNKMWKCQIRIHI